MLIEDFFAETNYIVPAIKNNYENTWNYLSNNFEIFKRNNILNEYYTLQGYNHIYLALAENLEKYQDEFKDLVEEYYRK